MEGSYTEQKERTMHLPALTPWFGREITNKLESTGTEIKVERKSNNTRRKTDADRATTNRESNPLQDADVDNSLKENLLQDTEINNSLEETLLRDTEEDNSQNETMDKTLLQDTEEDNSQNETLDQTLLRDTEEDNSRTAQETLLRDTENEPNSLEEEFPELVTTRSWRVSSRSTARASSSSSARASSATLSLYTHVASAKIISFGKNLSAGAISTNGSTRHTSICNATTRLCSLIRWLFSFRHIIFPIATKLIYNNEYWANINMLLIFYLALCDDYKL